MDEVQSLFEKWGVTSAEDLPVGAMQSPDQRADRERQLAAALLQARMGRDEDDERRMTDSGLRAGKILAYSESDDIEHMLKLEGYTRTSEMSQSDFIGRALAEHMNESAAESWSNTTPDETVLSFECPDDTDH